jgi:hypothetical protein
MGICLEGRYLLFHHLLAAKTHKLSTSRASTLYGVGIADATPPRVPAIRHHRGTVATQSLQREDTRERSAPSTADRGIRIGDDYT